MKIINVERTLLQDMYHTGKASEEIVRKIEREPDLEASRLTLIVGI